MEIKAKLNNLRLAPRKVRAVSNLIKGKNVIDALGQLDVMAKRPSLPVLKLLKSAISNAENTYNMVKENLYVKSIRVDEGVKLKRFKAKGFGRVSPLEKKASHISLILEERVVGMKMAQPLEKKIKVEQTSKTEEKIIKKSIQDKPEIKTELGKREGVFGNIGKKIFRRKVI